MRVVYFLQLHLAALGSLRGEISELHARLQRAAQDRDTLEQALAKTQVPYQLPVFLLFRIARRTHYFLKLNSFNSIIPVGTTAPCARKRGKVRTSIDPI